MSDSAHLPPRQARAIAALLATRTVVEAAQAARVSPSTVRRWLRDPSFRDAYAEECRQVRGDARLRLSAAVEKAVAALERNVECGTPAVEVQAAHTVLRHAMGDVEAELEERVAALERARLRSVS